ncbi:MAG: cytochrome c oxidase assembly protein [Thiobacillaceae bacterium]|nr:cytochrome c oxidase assembly protein [Thiobacillaceae bacterium]
MRAATDQSNRRWLTRLALLAAGMFAFGFALVPLYRVFCELTGLNRDAIQALVGNTQVDYGRTVRVELIAHVPDARLLRFTAPTHALRVHPGALVQVEFELENLSDRPLLGRAVPSFGPAAAAAHFRKLDCFCFREQRLAPRERLRLPVLFVLDRRLPEAFTTVSVAYTIYATPQG